MDNQELRKKAYKVVDKFFDAGGREFVIISEKDYERIVGRQLNRARLAECETTALDNYQGQTFSKSTNYKGKWEKFVRNNEKRIDQLKRKTNDE
jgi:hypothetical protein